MAQRAGTRDVKAIAVDAFPVFDPAFPRQGRRAWGAISCNVNVICVSEHFGGKLHGVALERGDAET